MVQTIEELYSSINLLGSTDEQEVVFFHDGDHDKLAKPLDLAPFDFECCDPSAEELISNVPSPPLPDRKKKIKRSLSCGNLPDVIKQPDQLLVSQNSTPIKKDAKLGTSNLVSSRSCTNLSSCFSRSNIEEDYKCAICLDTLKRPVQLGSCRHIFCRECLRKAAPQFQNCPLCRTAQSLEPANNIESRILGSFIKKQQTRSELKSLKQNNTARIQEDSLFAEFVTKSEAQNALNFRRNYQYWRQKFHRGAKGEFNSVVPSLVPPKRKGIVNTKRCRYEQDQPVQSELRKKFLKTCDNEVKLKKDHSINSLDLIMMSNEEDECSYYNNSSAIDFYTPSPTSYFDNDLSAFTAIDDFLDGLTDNTATSMHYNNNNGNGLWNCFGQFQQGKEFLSICSSCNVELPQFEFISHCCAVPTAGLNMTQKQLPNSSLFNHEENAVQQINTLYQQQKQQELYAMYNTGVYPQSETKKAVPPRISSKAKKCSRAISPIETNLKWESLMMGFKPLGRFEHSVVVYGDQMFVFGGTTMTSNSTQSQLNDFHVFRRCSSSFEWVQNIRVGGDIPPADTKYQSVLVGSYMYVIGGTHDGKFLTDVYRVNLNSNKGEYVWQKLDVSGELPTKRYWYSLCAIGSSVYLFGGYCNNQIHNDVYLLQTDASEGKVNWNSIETSGTAPVRRRGHQAVPLISEHVQLMVVFGGYTGRCRLNDIHVLDISSNNWSCPSIRGTLPNVRYNHQCVMLYDHKQQPRLYVFGGNSGTLRNDLYVLDCIPLLRTPESQKLTWYQPVVQGSKPMPRYWHSCAVIDEQLIVFGGYSGKQCLQDVNMLNLKSFHEKSISFCSQVVSPKKKKRGAKLKN